MRINKFYATLFTTSALFLSTLADADQTKVSDFFQDWTLNAAESSPHCPLVLEGKPGRPDPSVYVIQGSSYDALSSVRFVEDDGPYEILTLGTTADEGDGFTNVKLVGNKLESVHQRKFFGFTKTLAKKYYTLTADHGVTVISETKKTKSSCVYKNAHEDMVNQVEVGATLFINNQEVAQCTFKPASPSVERAPFFSYNEKCVLGRYTDKRVIDLATRTVWKDLFLTTLPARPLEIVRSTKALNAATENFVSLDGELVMDDGTFDTLISNKSEYPFNPYRSNEYKIDGTSAKIRIDYAPVGVVAQ